MGIEKKDINEPEVSVGEIIEDMEKKKKDFTPSFPVDEDVEYIVKKKKHYSDFTTIKKVFTVPVLTMIGVWIIVYFQVTSHNHYGNGGTYKSISGSVSVR